MELAGPCPMATVLRREEERAGLAEYLGEALGVLEVEVRDAGLYSPIDLSRHVGQRHVLGEALALLQRARKDDSVLSRMTPSELARGEDFGDESERLGYLRELLTGLDAAAAERVLRKETE